MNDSQKNIHETAIIDETAEISDSAIIGAYCVIGGGVEITDNVTLHPHVVISGNTKIGKNTEIFPFASLGHKPQDLKFKGEKSELIIGKNNTIREHVTMNPGTEGGGSITSIGDNCLFMVGSHVAHDCQISDNVIMANNATLAGHVQIGKFTIIGGLAAVHQFVRIGKHAIIGGLSGVENDVIPFGSVMGERASLHGLNLIGLRRHNFKQSDIHTLRSIYKNIFETNEGTLKARAEQAKKHSKNCQIAEEVLEFINAKSHRSLCTNQ